MMPPGMTAAAAPAVAGAGGAPGQPPFGSSPVTQPVPNRGNEAAGMSRLAVIVRLMEETIPLLGVGTEPGQALLKSLNQLSKHLPPGSVSAGLEQSALQQLMQRQQQMAPQIAALRAMSAPTPPAAA